MPKRISAEAQVFKHFNLLSDESKRIVLDILNAWQQPAKPRVQVKKSSQKKAWLPVTQQQVDDGDPVAAAKHEAASGD